MFNLTRQVHVATDIARRGAAWLAQLEAPALEDKEKSIAELIARIDHTLASLQQLPEAAFEGSEQRSISLPLPAAYGGGEMVFEGWPYLSGFVLPNVPVQRRAAQRTVRCNRLLARLPVQATTVQSSFVANQTRIFGINTNPRNRMSCLLYPFAITSSAICSELLAM
jgi:hypothetical protein